MKKNKYVFNINTGHFVKILNEDDTNISSDITQSNNSNNSSTNTTNTNDVKSKAYISVESNEQIKNLNANIDSETKKYNDEISQLQKNLQQAKENAETNSSATGNYDHIETDSKVLAIKKNMLDKKYQYDTKIYQLNLQKITQLQNLATLTAQAKSTSERIYTKYKNSINESNIDSYKIYMKGLISNMNDMKKVMNESNLLYGKDSKDFFIVCVDNEDISNLYESLYNAGIQLENIRYVVMPQLAIREN